jgi:hypothetical protein
MSETTSLYTSLPELLEDLEGKPFKEANEVIQAEYANVSMIIENLRRERKTGRIPNVNPATNQYFEDLLCLVNAIDGHSFAVANASEKTLKLIEKTFQQWRTIQDRGG